MSSLQAWGWMGEERCEERRWEMTDRREGGQRDGELEIVGQSIVKDRIKKDEEVKGWCKTVSILYSLEFLYEFDFKNVF